MEYQRHESCECPQGICKNFARPLRVIIAVAFGALCFGCGYLAAFVVTRNKWRDEMIERGIARYNWQTGKWEWGEPPKSSD